MTTTTAPADVFMSLVQERRSCRAYDPTRRVPPEIIASSLEAARLAPSACNRQPWRFVIVTAAAQRQAICAKAMLPGIAHPWLTDAPVIVALCVDRDLITHGLAPMVSGIPYYLIDAGIAGEHFVLAATAHGLGTCWIGWFKEKAVRKILDIPRSVRVVSLLAAGYPATVTDASPAPNALPRRKPLTEIAFTERWGTGWAPAE